jgi:hypothetical protein
MKIIVTETPTQRVLIITLHPLAIHHYKAAVADFAVKQMLAYGVDRVDVKAS